MKIRNSILAFCIIIIALIVLIIWFGKQSVKVSMENVTLSNSIKNINAVVAIKPKTNMMTISNKSTLFNGINPKHVPRESTAQQRLEGLSTLNDIPIVFYGKVEDQFTNPIADATIDFDVRIYNVWIIIWCSPHAPKGMPVYEGP